MGQGGSKDPFGKQRLVLFELCSGHQDRMGQKEVRVHGAWESSHTAP